MTAPLRVLILNYMLDPKNVLSVTELKRETSKVLERVSKTKEPIYIMSRSKPKAAVINVKMLKKFEEALEDLEDIRAFEEAKNEPTISLEEFIKEHPHLKNIK